MTLKNNFLFILVLALVVFGCSHPVNFSAKSDSGQSQGGDTENTDGVPDCVVDVPQMTITGHVNSFEFLLGGGLTVGYNKGGSTPIGVHVGANVQVEQMDLSMLLVDTLLKGMVMGSVDVTSDRTKVNVNGGVDFGNISVGPSFDFNNPIDQVLQKAMTKALGDLITQLASNHVPWAGRVIKTKQGHDKNQLVISAGTQAGAQVGDQFAIYNMAYDWGNGPICGTLADAWRDPVTPVAVVQITSVGSFTSQASFVSQTGIAPRRGASVAIQSLVNGRTNLKMRLQLGLIKAAPLDLDNGTSIDIQDGMNAQFQNIVYSSDAFYYTLP